MTNILTTIIVGIIWGKLDEVIVFLVLIIPLGSIAGVYHAERSLSCFFASLSLYFITMLLSDKMIFNIKLYFVVFILFAVLIGIMTPVDSVYKKLQSEQRNFQKKQYRFLVVMISVIFLLFINLRSKTMCNIVVLVLFFVTLTQVLGIIKNSIEGRKSTI